MRGKAQEKSLERAIAKNKTKQNKKTIQILTYAHAPS